MALDNLFVLPSIRMNSESHLTAISNQGASDELPARATVFQSFIYSCWMRRGGYLCEGGKWLTYPVREAGCPDDENSSERSGPELKYIELLSYEDIKSIYIIFVEI